MNNGRNIQKLFSFLLGVATALGAGLAHASVYDSIRQKLEARYPEASIELSHQVKWIRGAFAESDLLEDLPVTLLGESAQGGVAFEVWSKDKVLRAEGSLQFSAWLEGRKAVRRIQVGEHLSDDLFRVARVDIAQGAAYEIKHSLAAAVQSVEGLEAKQSIAEGGWLLTHAADRIPDVRKGDRIPIRLLSGELMLTTTGIAQESGVRKQRIKVLSSKGKREFTGELSADGSVEVHL